MRHQVSRRDVLALTAGATATALSSSVAGCFGSGGDDSGAAEEPENAGEPGTPATSFQVSAISRPYPRFEPQVIHVEPGATVEWLVESGRHDVTAYHRDQHAPHHTPEGVEPWGSGRLTGAGATFEHTFEEEGIYDYVDTQQVCVAHEIAGNVGRVIVGWPELENEPAMTPPSEDLPSRVRNAFEMFNEETHAAYESRP